MNVSVATRTDTSTKFGSISDPLAGSLSSNVILFPELKNTSSVSKKKEPTRLETCYPKCMVDTKEQQLVISEDEERRVLTSAFETEMDTTPQPFDLEELGLSDTSQISQQLVKSIVVDYEESDRDDDKLRNVDATCAPSACGPLEEGVARDELSTGRLYRHRSSSDSLKGKSVIFEPNMKIASRITSESDPEQSVHRCVKVPKLCMCEVKLHRSLESCWLVSSGHVYDVTGLVTAHPGGIDSILRKAGGPDCAQDMKFHSKRARKMMEKCYIGKLARCGDEVDEATCNVM